jgi:hypothetical protein
MVNLNGRKVTLKTALIYTFSRRAFWAAMAQPLGRPPRTM